MSWRDDMIPASFRGVGFYVMSSDADFGGMGGEHHRYPQRNTGYFEELGTPDPQFGFSAFVIGDNYRAARDTLIAACRTAGLGTLQHPYHGVRQVTCIGCRVVESRERGGMAELQLTFLETSEQVQPSGIADTTATLNDSASAGLLTVARRFVTATAALADAADFITDAVAAVITTAGTAIAAATLPCAVTLDALGQALLPEAAAILKRGLDIPAVQIRTADAAGWLFDQAVSALPELDLSRPSAAAETLQGVVLLAPVLASAADDLAGWTVLERLWAWGEDLPAVPMTTPSRQIQADAQAATIDLVRTTAVIQAARMIPALPWDSADQALGALDRLVDAIDTVAGSAPDDLYLALVDLRAAATNATRATAADLARLSRWTPEATTPAVVLAYRLYDDIDHESDIIARNGLAHPGFTPAGEPLAILVGDGLVGGA